MDEVSAHVQLSHYKSLGHSSTHVSFNFSFTQTSQPAAELFTHPPRHCLWHWFTPMRQKKYQNLQQITVVIFSHTNLLRNDWSCFSGKIPRTSNFRLYIDGMTLSMDI